ncbi:hypothetical protein HETIRDRAFT_422253 [Heterobasidion irregulare TC 32-1]|uniref:Uncharacterized protein n=1 Tax=Heterobasidion irregulare (strain TC 32-1) TaxID=747525 RepID=W4JTN3_HETIT|nr:uncharacterized protein HETIRDRAFT_422253 [Heterobasidion irregulare TC 32-1]ETW76898.1 hypothetical protein HETIRDRAFT_422253 [Heterobasidion irregulare TC 32-1]
MTEHAGDRAMLDFCTCLTDHLLARFMGLTYDGDEHSFADEQLLQLEIMQNRMYEHNVLRINYTSYDVRRLQHSINPQTHPDIMVLSHDDVGPNAHLHPYWYAHVLSIFHVMARYIGPKSQLSEMQRMDFLWVRWYGLDPDMCTGWHARRLPAVGFVPETDPDVFGFLNPQEVLRGAHLIPAFHHSLAEGLLHANSCARRANEDQDWNLFYPNI